jgi:prepilin peptidase CpaA
MNSELLAFLDLVSMLFTNPRTGALIICLLLAAWSDWRTRRIPNWLVLAGTGAGLLLNTLDTGASSIGLLGALQGLAVAFALFLPFFLLRAMGAGDVKLMAMAGAFLGLPHTIYAVGATAIAGGALSLVYLAWHGGLRRALFNIVGALQGALLAASARTRPSLSIAGDASVGSLPYGVAIAAGTIGYLLLRQLGFLD